MKAEYILFLVVAVVLAAVLVWFWLRKKRAKGKQ